MRRRFTLQLGPTPKPHAHVCHECCVQWECRLPTCFIEFIVDDREHLGSDCLDMGEDTLCNRCLDYRQVTSQAHVDDLAAVTAYIVAGKR